MTHALTRRPPEAGILLIRHRLEPHVRLAAGGVRHDDAVARSLAMRLHYRAVSV